jgi:hypothetical protein
MHIKSLTFFTPPECQMIVSSSYAYDIKHNQIVCMSFDALTGVESYAVTPANNLVGDFDPFNERPRFHDQGLWIDVK